MNDGFVYFGELEANEVKRLLEGLSGKFIHFVWTLKSFAFDEGLPKDLGDSGTAFNHKCEIKWQRAEGGKFRVVFLSDEPIENLPLKQVGGRWETEELTTELFSLDDKRIAPKFERYPVVKSVKAKLRCRVFYCKGVAMFISPREVIKDETST